MLIKNLPQEKIDQILDFLDQGQNYNKTAIKAQVPERVVRRIDFEYNERWKVSEDGMGKRSLRRFIVAVRHVDTGWPRKDAKIDKAREDYDKGIVELCQGRDGFNIILYAIPRKRRIKRPVYFKLEEET